MDVREKTSNEKRLIDANRALEIVRDQRIAHPNAYHLTNYATLILLEAPTVDAVEVVRCEYCDKGHPELGMNGCVWCVRYSRDMNTDDFCSYGDRKDG